MKQKLIEAYGWYGAIAIIVAYALSNFGMLETQSLIYQFLNLTGAIGIVVVSVYKKAYQPATLNSVWAVIALIALLAVAL